MSTRKPLKIWLGSHHELADQLRKDGHEVDCGNAEVAPDLVIGPNNWHLPDNAPNPDEYLARAIAWMQERKYGKATKPAKRRERASLYEDGGL